MAILEETYNYEQNIAKIFSDHNVRETNFDILTSLDMGDKRPPHFQNSSKNLFHIDSE